MRIPIWVTLAIAALVLGFGGYRLYLALKKPPLDVEEASPQRRGLYAMSKRSHLLIGAVYLLLGIGLVATSFGWNPFGGAVAGDTEAPKPGAEPSKPGSVPVDQLK
jgi:hypothetical protein